MELILTSATCGIELGNVFYFAPSELNLLVMSTEAPQARNAKAWGNAPGEMFRENSFSAKGAERLGIRLVHRLTDQPVLLFRSFRAELSGMSDPGPLAQAIASRA